MNILSGNLCDIKAILYFLWRKSSLYSSNTMGSSAATFSLTLNPVPIDGTNAAVGLILQPLTPALGFVAQLEIGQPLETQHQVFVHEILEFLQAGKLQDIRVFPVRQDSVITGPILQVQLQRGIPRAFLF